MKIARIVLTATMLLSLKSTLFCSSESEKEISTTSTQASRIPSFDLAIQRSGFLKATGTKYFGKNQNQLAQETLDRCGEIEDGKQIRPGSPAESVEFWNNHIQTLEQAQAFKAATEKVKNVMSTLVSKKADDLIEAEAANAKALRLAEIQKINDSVSIEALKLEALGQVERQKAAAQKQAKFEQMQTTNNASIALLATYHKKTQDYPVTLARIEAESQAKIKTYEEECNAECQAKLTAFTAAHTQDKHDLAATLQNNIQKINDLEANLGITFKEKFVVSQTSITKDKLSKLAAKYQDGKTKTATFAEITANDSLLHSETENAPATSMNSLESNSDKAVLAKTKRSHKK